jgi:hypothetical protein
MNDKGKEEGAGMMARRQRCRLAATWLGIAMNAETWVTRAIDYSGAATVWASVDHYHPRFDIGAWVQPHVVSVYLVGMGVFAIFATLVLGGIVTGLVWGKRKTSRGCLIYLKWFHATTGIILIGNNFLVWLISGYVLSMMAIDTIANLVAWGITEDLISKTNCTEQEARHFRIESRRIRARIDEANDKSELDEIKRELDGLTEQCSITGFRLLELDLAREQLAMQVTTLKTTTIIHQTLEENKDKAVNVELLLSLSGLPSDKFALLLLDLCKRFDLSISGDTVTFHGDADIAAFVRDVDSYFARWRENEAIKAGKQTGD